MAVVHGTRWLTLVSIAVPSLLAGCARSKRPPVQEPATKQQATFVATDRALVTVSQDVADIHRPTEAGDLAKVKALLDKDPTLITCYLPDRPECDSFRGRATPLHVAARRGHREVVELLLRYGADVNVESAFATPLHSAVAGNQEEIVKLLLERGAKVEAADPGGRTALHVAAARGRAGAARLLLKNGANVNAKTTRYGKRPLHMAVSGRHLAVAEILLSSGASVDSRTHKGQLDCDTPLLWASANGDVRMIELLLGHGADVGIRGVNGLSTLYWAAVRGHREAAELLVARGAEIGVFEAVMLDRDARVTSLVTRNPRLLRERSPDGLALLHLAAKCGAVRAARALLATGADPNVRIPEVPGGNKTGRTPLHFAAQNGHAKVAEILVASKADVNAVDKWGQTPLHATAGHSGTTDGHLAVATLLLEKGAEVGAKYNGTTTALHIAAKFGDTRMVDLLLGSGADINAVCECPACIGTPLHLAAERNRKDIVRLLLSRGADPNAKDRDGRTPADRAWGEVAGILKQHGR